ncbi:WhiB family transcriptional regulator [Streptomyces canus]|uniref:WhiB family transcriptional regulator n=1 Tax=Streptomyces canus TaxID=58343 RepID=UPI003CF46243
MSYTGSIPDTLAHRHDWMADMACRTEKPETFFEKKHEHEARVICAVRCRVRAQCLAHVQRLERGDAEDRRDGVVAGLTAHERWRLDATAPGHSDKPALVFTGEPPRCGTYSALLRHLWMGEQIDPECWSGEIRRERLNRATTATRKEPAEPAPVPKPVMAPRKQPQAKGGTPHERRIYRLWAEGLTDLQIARRMAISVPQVERVCVRLGLLPNAHTKKAS